MRLLSLLLIFTLVAPPAQLIACDEGKDATTGQHAHHSMAGPAETGSQHDCCDPAADVNDITCSHSVHCGACPAAGFVGPGSEPLPLAWQEHHRLDRRSGTTLPSHSLPPFRPPTVLVLS